MKNSLKRKFLFGLICSGLATNSVSVYAESDTSGLIDIFQMAQKEDATLAQNQYQFQADQANLNSIEGGLYPQISLDANYNRTRSAGTSDYDIFNKSLNLQQSLYQHELWARIKQSKQALKYSNLQVAAAEQELILRTTEAYFKVLLAEKNVELIQAQVDADAKQLETAQASAEVGLASRVDVLQAQSSYDLSRSQLISTQNALDIAKSELETLIGQQAPKLKVLDVNTRFTYKQLDKVALQDSAKINNLNVKLAQAAFDIAQQEVEVAKSGYWPTVSATASLKDTDYLTGTGNEGTSNAINVNFSLPVFTGGAVASNVDAARFGSKKSAEVLKDTKKSARLSTQVYVRNLEQGKALIAALREAVKSNDTFLEATEEGYKVGLKDLLDVLSARANQLQANKNLMEAMHNQMLNRLRLEAALGDLTVQDLREVDAYLGKREG